MKPTTEDRVVNLSVYVLLGVIGIATLYPFYYTMICSLNDGMDLMRGGVYLWPRKFSLASYVEFLRDPDWINAFGVTVARTVIGAFASTLFTCLVSYGLSRKELMFRKTFRFLVVFTMYFSGGLIPFYVLLRQLALLNSFWVYIIPTMFSGFFAMIGINFFSSIPESLIEAARLDGARETYTFFRIVLPVSVPLLATMGLFQAVNQWNSWLDSAYYVRSKELFTMAYKMMVTINKTIASSAVGDAGGQMSESMSTTNFSVQATAMVISMLPIMCAYPFVQKYFVQGMMLGSVKE
jgi:putative aldouronate transport system permease protein